MSTRTSWCNSFNDEDKRYRRTAPSTTYVEKRLNFGIFEESLSRCLVPFQNKSYNFDFFLQCQIDIFTEPLLWSRLVDGNESGTNLIGRHKNHVGREEIIETRVALFVVHTDVRFKEVFEHLLTRTRCGEVPREGCSKSTRSPWSDARSLILRMNESVNGLLDSSRRTSPSWHSSLSMNSDELR